jgi:hypothetical protein
MKTGDEIIRPSQAACRHGSRANDLVDGAMAMSHNRKDPPDRLPRFPVDRFRCLPEMITCHLSREIAPEPRSQ